MVSAPNITKNADIPESFFEYRAEFTDPMLHLWTIPNQLVADILPVLKKWNVGLADITTSKDPKNFKEIEITFGVQQLRAAVKVGVEHCICIAANPDWSEAPALIALFEAALQQIKKSGGSEIASQRVALAMHVTPGLEGFGKLMERLVNVEELGAGEMYGVSVYNRDSLVLLDKSVRFKDALFVRLQRDFHPSASFAEIAQSVYEDEIRVLRLLHLEQLAAKEGTDATGSKPV